MNTRYKFYDPGRMFSQSPLTSDSERVKHPLADEHGILKRKGHDGSETEKIETINSTSTEEKKP